VDDAVAVAVLQQANKDGTENTETTAASSDDDQEVSSSLQDAELPKEDL